VLGRAFVFVGKLELELELVPGDRMGLGQALVFVDKLGRLLGLGQALVFVDKLGRLLGLGQALVFVDRLGL
jgi:hypothetical protein